MSGNTIGNIFKLTTFGESHGHGIGGVIDGCPANVEIDKHFISQELARRKPGQSKIVTQRKENEDFQVFSGIFEGKTTGSPIGFFIENTNQRSQDYDHIKNTFRPSHADFTYQEKYGHRDYRGGGRSSARETAARVFGGAIAKTVLKQKNISINAFVSAVGDIEIPKPFEADISETEKNIARCPDASAAKKMISLIDKTRKSGNTIGGVISCIAQGIPVGIGEPVFDRLDAELAKAMLSINATKGFEIGSGFSGTKMLGSEHNDIFTNKNGKVSTTTNNSGGIQGGISNGMPICFRVAFKPIATIMKPQETIGKNGGTEILEGKGRHDPCVVPRAVPIVEAMASITILDMLMIFYAKKKLA